MEVIRQHRRLENSLRLGLQVAHQRRNGLHLRHFSEDRLSLGLPCSTAFGVLSSGKPRWHAATVITLHNLTGDFPCPIEIAVLRRSALFPGHLSRDSLVQLFRTSTAPRPSLALGMVTTEDQHHGNAELLDGDVSVALELVPHISDFLALISTAGHDVRNLHAALSNPVSS